MISPHSPLNYHEDSLSEGVLLGFRPLLLSDSKYVVDIVQARQRVIVCIYVSRTNFIA